MCPPVFFGTSSPRKRVAQCLLFVFFLCKKRSFLRREGSPNIPIQAIGLSLYENLGTDGPVEQAGTTVTRTQWLDLSSLQMSNLIGKNILIVDEVDDTRTTLEYAVRELQKDVEAATKDLGRAGETTNFSIFVLHVRNVTHTHSFLFFFLSLSLPLRFWLELFLRRVHWLTLSFQLLK